MAFQPIPGLHTDYITLTFLPSPVLTIFSVIPVFLPLVTIKCSIEPMVDY